LIFSGKTFYRPIIDFDENQILELRIEKLPFAYCSRTKSYFRILPIEIAPFGKISLRVKETRMKEYLESNETLKQVVSNSNGIIIDKRSLYNWITALGNQGLDLKQHKKTQSKVTMGAIIEESTKRINSDIRTIWDAKYNISEKKYRSIKRKEQLESCLKTLKTAEFISPNESYPLTKWNSILMPIFYVTAFPISSVFNDTGSQLDFKNKHDIKGGIIKITKKLSKKGKNHGARSPPNSMF